MGRYTSLLYTTPSFLEGMGRIMDFGGALDMYNISETAEEADYAAMASDWWAVGEDFRQAIHHVASELEIELRDDR